MNQELNQPLLASKTGSLSPGWAAALQAALAVFSINTIKLVLGSFAFPFMLIWVSIWVLIVESIREVVEHLLVDFLGTLWRNLSASHEQSRSSSGLAKIVSEIPFLGRRVFVNCKVPLFASYFTD